MLIILHSPIMGCRGKVVLSKVAWSVPIVQPNDVRKVNLYKSIASNTFSVPQARYIVWQLGFSSAPGVGWIANEKGW